MASLLTVTKAVIERLSPVREVTYYHYMPRYIEAPAVTILPDFPFVNTELAQSSTLAEWNLLLTMMVDPVPELEAQEQLFEWLDPEGPFWGALVDDVDDTLGRLTSHVRVTSGSNFDEMKFHGTPYYYAQLRVSVKV